MCTPQHINPFHASGLFLYPQKTSESWGFLMFSGGTEKDQWHEMGYEGVQNSLERVKYDFIT